MHINLDAYPKEVRRENAYLRLSLGSEQGHQRYCWCWSDDFRMPLPVVDQITGAAVYDYRCPCGLNISVHQPTCTMSVPEQRWEMRHIIPDARNQWILAKWVRPEAARDEWESRFGASPYPDGGYYFPVGTPTQKLISIPAGQTPYRATSEEVVKGIRKHEESLKDLTRATEERWEKVREKRIADYELQFKDAFPVHTGQPGRKEEWSAGGIGPSPLERRLEAATAAKEE